MTDKPPADSDLHDEAFEHELLTAYLRGILTECADRGDAPAADPLLAPTRTPKTPPRAI